MLRPQRSPIEIPELVKEYIRGKIFCEIGCAEGDLLRLFAKYAKEAIGIECKPRFFPKLWELESEYFNVRIIQADALRMSIPKCEVYYFWCRPNIDKELIRILPPSTMMIHKTLANKWWLELKFGLYKGTTEYIDFKSNEMCEIDGKDLIDEPLVIGIFHKEGK